MLSYRHTDAKCVFLISFLCFSYLASSIWILPTDLSSNSLILLRLLLVNLMNSSFLILYFSCLAFPFLPFPYLSNEISYVLMALHFDNYSRIIFRSLSQRGRKKEIAFSGPWSPDILYLSFPIFIKCRTFLIPSISCNIILKFYTRHNI